LIISVLDPFLTPILFRHDKIRGIDYNRATPH
jgi:hypothetical protein